METMYLYIGAGLFMLGLFVGLYIGKCNELRRLKKSIANNKNNSNQKNNNNNNVVQINKNKKAC